MELAVGEVLEGKVTGITKFGAFVSLGGGKSGMVHISEIAHAYVSDINEYLTVGQDVKVKIIAMENGKINLSIKKCTEAPQRTAARTDRRAQGRDARERRSAGAVAGGSRQPVRAAVSKEPQSFDDMLKRFMADSDNKLSSVKQYSDHRTKRKRNQ